MRIIHFTNSYFPRLSGVARSVYNLKKGLEKYGHKVLIISPKYYFKDRPKKDVIKIGSLRPGKFFGSLNYPIPLSNINFKKIEKVFLEFNPDIIHSHHPFFLGKTALKLSKKYKIPLVYTYHTPYFKYFEKKDLKITNFVKDFFINIVNEYGKNCKAIILPTEKMKEYLIRELHYKCFSLPSPVDINEFSNFKKNYLKKKYNLPKNSKILLTVSRLSYERNISFLIDSFSLIFRKQKNIYFLIVGGGYYKKILEYKVKIKGIEKFIIFCGNVPYKELKNYYYNSDIFLYAPLFDSQGLVITEALICGLPILIFDKFGSAKFIIKNNKTGFITNTEKEFIKILKNLISSEDLRNKISKNQIKIRKNFSIENISKKIINIYNKILL